MYDATHPVKSLVVCFLLLWRSFSYISPQSNQSAKQNLGSNVIVITVTEVGHIRFNASWQNLSDKSKPKKINSLAVSYLILEISNHLCSNCRRGRQKAAKFLSMSRWEILKIMTTCAKYGKQMESKRVKLLFSPEWGIKTHMLFMGRTDSKQCLF